MKLLNLCCGNTRVVDDVWVNLDNLHEVLLPGTPERENLDREQNYQEFYIGENGKFPQVDGFFDGILASHCFEHWDCQQGVRVMKECHRILKPGGVLLVSVPDAAVFRRNHAEDTVENAERLFGEPIFLGDGEKDFCGYALFNRWHKTVLSEDSLWCYFVRAGFKEETISRRMNIDYSGIPSDTPEPRDRMLRLLNRIPFSLIMQGRKTT